MALYAIGDLHLSLNSNKSMEVFGPAWENYTERIRASLSQLTAEDVRSLWHVISVLQARMQSSDSQSVVLESFLDSVVHKDLPVW